MSKHERGVIPPYRFLERVRTLRRQYGHVLSAEDCAACDTIIEADGLTIDFGTHRSVADLLRRHRL